MALYRYEAKNSVGEMISGSVLAETESDAAGRVRSMGYYPLRLTAGGDGVASPHFVEQTVYQGSITGVRQPVSTPPVYGTWLERHVAYPIWTGVSLRDLAQFYRQISAMLNAGVPLYRSLTTVQQQSKPGLMRIAVARMAEHVRSGGALSEAMCGFPYLFTVLHRSMIAAGEMTGNIDEMMRTLADYLENEDGLRKTIKRETLQSKITFVAAMLLPTLVIAVVQGVGAYFHQTVVPLIELIIAGGIIYAVGRWALAGSIGLRTGYDTIKAFIPYFGQTIRLLSFARFCRAFSSLYKSGVLIPRALQIAASVSGNSYVSSALMRGMESLRHGASLTETLARTGVVPPMVISMVSTGETTGSLDATMAKAADYYESESAVRLHQSVVYLGFISLLIAAVIVGITLVHFYSGSYVAPYNDLMNNPE